MTPDDPVGQCCSQCLRVRGSRVSLQPSEGSAGWSGMASLTCPTVLLAVAWGVSVSKWPGLSAWNLSQLPCSLVAPGAMS